MEQKVIEVLERKFDAANIKTRQGAGSIKLKYLEAQIVTRRLNEAFNQDWSFEIRDSKIVEGNIYVLGRLTVPDGKSGYIWKESYGGKKVAIARADKSMLDLGNDMKAAQSDALKKCSSLLGIGLDLYGEDEKTTEDDSKPEVEVQSAATVKASSIQLKAINSIAAAKKVPDLNMYASKVLGRVIIDLADVSESEAKKLITELNTYVAK